MLMVPVIFGVHYQYMHYGIAIYMYFNFSNEYVYFSIMQMYFFCLLLHVKIWIHYTSDIKISPFHRKLSKYYHITHR